MHCDLLMFMIPLPSSKAYGWRTFPNCGAELGYHMIVGSLFWECPTTLGVAPSPSLCTWIVIGLVQSCGAQHAWKKTLVQLDCDKACPNPSTLKAQCLPVCTAQGCPTAPFSLLISSLSQAFLSFFLPRGASLCRSRVLHTWFFFLRFFNHLRISKKYKKQSEEKKRFKALVTCLDFLIFFFLIFFFLPQRVTLIKRMAVSFFCQF